jgi:hypothetical protein
VKIVLASLIVLAFLGGHAHAYFNLADQLFSIPTYVGNHLADEDLGNEFRRWDR